MENAWRWCFELGTATSGAPYTHIHIIFRCLWNKETGRMADRRIGMIVCEGVVVAQALLLLFQRAWPADFIKYMAPITSPSQCSAIILASRSTTWSTDGPGGVSRRSTWETGQEGPELLLVASKLWRCSLILSRWTYQPHLFSL
eukprot:jgi/Botrbrau1/11168/Bobra.182_2s0023.1